MKVVDGVLHALGDPTRRRVVELLSEHPRNASDLADASGMSRPAMSRHLRVLRRHGLIDVTSGEEDARLRIFRLRPEPFDGLQDWLNGVRAFWTDQLAAFKAYAETNASAAKTTAATAKVAHPSRRTPARKSSGRRGSGRQGSGPRRTTR